MPRHYLLSRRLDPLLGVFTGFLAYYLHETNPRTAPPPGHTLKDLVRWQWGENSRRRDEAAAASAATEQADLEAVRRELEGAEKMVESGVLKAVDASKQAAHQAVGKVEKAAGKAEKAVGNAVDGVKEMADKAV